MKSSANHYGSSRVRAQSDLGFVRANVHVERLIGQWLGGPVKTWHGGMGGKKGP